MDNLPRIETPTATPRSASTSTSTSGKASGDGALNSDFETFLKMLTAQMRNQDPLSPMDSADFAVQLATFSGVEQQVRTNDLLTALGERLTQQSLGQLSGWIGLTARTTAPVRFDGSPLQVQAEVDPKATAAELRVTDDQGLVVQRAAVPAQTGPLLWDGRGPAGQPLPPGSYTLTVDSLGDRGVIASHPVAIQGRVTEARMDHGETRLRLDTGQDVAADRVQGLRAPQDAP